MTVYNIHEAKTRFSELIRKAMRGEEVIIARAGKPIAVLTPFQAPPAPRVPGRDAGTVVVHDDFDDPLPEFDS